MKKKFVVLIIILLILISGGIGLATFFISSANEHAVTFDDDTEALYQTTLLETPKDGTNPNNYDAKTNVYYALYNLEHKEAFSCTTTGTAKASVATQIISNSRVVIGDKALVSTISDGIIKVGTQKYFVNGGKKVLLRSSESVSDAKATWKKDVPECITDKAYLQRYGWLPFKAIGYIICDDTILEVSEMKCENGIYEVSLTLDPAPDKAPYYYKREVATNGSSTIVPEFSYVNLTYKFDSNWNVIEVHAQEKYLVKSMGIKTTCETNCFDKYSYDNVEFDKDSYEFFKQYETLEAEEENENNESKIDALTMLTSSLTNNDSFESLNINIKFNNKEVEGLAALDINDLTNIKVKVLAGDLYIEYSDLLYISLGELKLKSDTETLSSLLNEFNGTIPNVEAIDTASILAAFDNAKIKEIENESIVNVTFNLFGYDINLEYSIYKDDEGYILNYARINANVEGNSVEINATPSDKKFPSFDKEAFSDLSNLDYLFKFFSKLILTNNVEAKFNITYNDINVDLNLKATFKDSIALKALVNLNYKDNNYNLVLTYINDSIYVSYDDVNLMISKDDLINIINKYTNKLNDIKSIDVKTIIETIMDLNYYNLFKEVIVSNEELTLTTNLEQLIGLLDDIQITISSGDDFDIKTSYKNLNVKGSIKAVDELEINLDDKEYNNIYYVNDFLDKILTIINSKKLESSISLNYNELNILGNIKLDFNDLNNIKAEANLTISKDNNYKDLNVIFINNTIYLEFANQKLSLTIDSLKEILNKFDISLDLNNEIKSNNILDIILSIDFEKLIKELTIEKDQILLNLDISDYINTIDNLEIKLTNNSDSIDLSLNIFDVKANVKASNFEINEPKDYQSLDNLIGLVDNIKSIIETKKIKANVSLNVKGLDITGKAHVDFTDLNNLEVEATLTVSKNNNSQELNVVFINNVIYVEVAGQKLSLTLDGLKEILSKFDISIDLNTDIDVNNIIDKVLSLDFNKLINDLSITENKLSLGLNLSDLIESLNELNIELINNKDSIDLTLNKFDVKANVKASNYEITEPTDYQSLDNLIGLVDNIKSIIDAKKIEANVSLNVKGIDITGTAYVDFNDINNLKAEATLTVSKNGNSQELNVTFYNNVIYVEVAGQKLSLTLDGLKEILAKFDINFDLNTNIDVNSIIDKVLSLDFNKLINELSITENKLSLGLNLSDFIESLNELNIELINNKDSIDLSLNKFDVKANVKASNFEITEPTEYQSLDNLIGLVDNIKSIIDTKSVEATVSLEVEGFNVSGIINIDFNDIKNLKANGSINLRKDNFEIDLNVSFVNNIIYLDVAGQKLSLSLDGLKSILAKFDINLDSNFELDNLIDKVLSIDLEKLIQKLEVEDNLISLGLDLSDLTSLLADINLSINNYDDHIELKTDKYNLFVSAKPSTFDLNVNGDYEQIDNIIEFIDIIKNIIDNKKLKANLSGNYKDISFDGYALIDFNDEIKVKAIIDLSYKNINVPLELYYFDKYDDLSNVIYLNVNNIHGYVKLEDVLSIFNVDTNDSIVDKLSLINFEKLIENINFESNEINLNIDLGYLLNDIFNIDLDLNELNLKVSKVDNHINISSDIIDNLNISLFDNFNEEIVLPNYNYINLSNVLSNVSDILDIYNKKSFSINLDGNINLNKVIDFDLNLDIEFKAIAKFILNNDKYDIEVSIDIDNEKFEGNISLIIIDKILYLKLSDIYIELDLNNINEFIKDIKEIFELDGDDLDLENVINSLISNVEFKDVNNILLDLNEVVSKLSILSIELNDLFNEESYINLKNNNLEDLLNASIKLNVDESLSLSSLNNKYLNSNDVLNICKNIKSLIDLIKKKEFKINLGSEGNGIEYFEDGKLKFNVVLDLDLSFVSNIKLNLNLRIDEYADGQYACTHKLNIIYVDEMMYATYGNSPSEREVIKAYSNKENILGLISSIEKVTGFDLEFINKYINYKDYANESLDHININNFKKLISKLITNSGLELGKININDVLRSLDVTANVSTFGVDLSSVLNNNKPYVTLIDLIKTNGYPSLELDKLYLSYEANDNYKLIENVNVSFNDFEEVVAPTIDNSYYNLNDLSKLIDGLITAASFNSYSIKGTVTLTANIVFKINVDIPIEAYVYVDEEGKPIVYGHIDMNDIPGIASIAGISKKDIYFVYENEFIYINRIDNGGTTHKIKVSIETFMDDIVYYLLDFSMGLPDSILSLIGQNQKEGYQYINAYNAVNNYKSTISSNLQSFFFNLNMGELTNNSDLGDMSFNINLKPLKLEDDYKGFSAYSISNFNFDMVNILTLHSDELYLSNLKNENGVYVYNDAVIDGKNVLDYVDSYIKTNFYINSKEIEADIIYNNNQKGDEIPHNAYFHYGNAVDLNGNSLETISIETTAGKSYGIPNGVEYAKINGKTYYFDGWYDNKNYEGEAFNYGDEAIMINKNVHYYAKWVLMYDYVVIDALGNGLNKAYKKGELTDDYTLDNSTSDFKGFFNSDTNELITTDSTLKGVIIENDITIYAKYSNMYYIVLDDEKNIALGKADSTLTISALTANHYSIYDGVNYYVYNNTDITAKLLFDEYSSLFEIENVDGIEIGYIHIYTYKQAMDGYNNYKFNYNSNFKNELDNGLYTNILIPINSSFDSSYFQKGYYGNYEINAWVSNSGKYYNKFIEVEDGIYNFKAYVSTRLNVLNISSTTINGYKNNTNDTLLITPIYNEDGSIITKINSKAFESNAYLETVVISEGITNIGNDAFKNNTSLKKVYFADSVTSVASDAFYIEVSSTFETNRDYAAKITFYFGENSKCSKSKWLACKWNWTSDYYGDSYSGLIHKYDFSNAFATYSVKLYELNATLL